MSDQDCCSSKNVLRTADMQATISSVTATWGSTKEAVVDSRRAETVQCCDYYLHLWPLLFYLFQKLYIHIITKQEFVIWPGILGQRHSPSHWIRVSRKQKHKQLNLGLPRCPAPRAGRQQGRRRPGRLFECRQASLLALQNETDCPSHQLFWQ
jgi:hypothetical protein